MEKQLITGSEPMNPVYWDERNQPSFLVDGSGLTKREYFAALAMQGFCAAAYGDFNDNHKDHIATLAVSQADALIAELNK